MVDGFELMPAVPETIVDLAVSILQHRGPLRRAYAGTTLLDERGLKRPPTRSAAAHDGSLSA